MPDVLDELRRYAEWLDTQEPAVSADQVLSCAPDTVREVELETEDLGATSRRRLAIAAAVVVVIAVAASAFLLLRRGDESSGVITGPDVDLTTGWVQVDQAFGSQARTVALGSNGTEVIAIVEQTVRTRCIADVGSSPEPQESDTFCSTPVALEAWTSSDGITWNEGDPLAAGRDETGNRAAVDASVNTVVWNGQQWLAAGALNGEPMVWVSAGDGTWSTSGVAGDGKGTVTGLALFDGGAIAVGEEGGHAVSWRIEDPLGIRWGDDRFTDVVPLPTLAAPTLTAVFDIVVSRKGLVAVGHDSTRPRDAVTPQPVAWVSNDGLDWDQIVLSTDLGTAAAAAVLDDLVVVVGRAADLDAAWTLPSSDPSDVSQILVGDGRSELAGATTESRLLAAAAGPDGLVASGWGSTGVTNSAWTPGLFVSGDGLSWAAVPSSGITRVEPGGAVAGSIATVVTHGHGFVAAAGPTVWVRGASASPVDHSRAGSGLPEPAASEWRSYRGAAVFQTGLPPEEAWIRSGPTSDTVPSEVYDAPEGNLVGYDYEKLGFVSVATAESPVFDPVGLRLAIYGCDPVLDIACSFQIQIDDLRAELDRRGVSAESRASFEEQIEILEEAKREIEAYGD
jgi:hypothetical protein